MSISRAKGLMSLDALIARHVATACVTYSLLLTYLLIYLLTYLYSASKRNEYQEYFLVVKAAGS